MIPYYYSEFVLLNAPISVYLNLLPGDAFITKNVAVISEIKRCLVVSTVCLRVALVGALIRVYVCLFKRI